MGVARTDEVRYAYSGVTAVRCSSLNRDELFEALCGPGVYGTTGARIHVAASRTAVSLSVVLHATAPLAAIRVFTPKRLLEELLFDQVAPDQAAEAAVLFLNPTRGEWDTTAAFSLGDEDQTQPLIIETVQQDGHHAWALVPPPAR